MENAKRKEQATVVTAPAKAPRTRKPRVVKVEGTQGDLGLTTEQPAPVDTAKVIAHFVPQVLCLTFNPAVVNEPSRPGPVKTVWDICAANPTKSRKEILALCAEVGVNPATAATQYQRYMHRLDKSVRPATTRTERDTLSPVGFVWFVCERNAHLRRSEVLRLLAQFAINKHTAATQYQKWFQANKAN